MERGHHEFGVVIHGNDGVGKSTIVQMISKNPEQYPFFVVERSSGPEYIDEKTAAAIGAAMFNPLTLKNAFQEEDLSKLPAEHIRVHDKDIPLYHVVLDASVPEIEQRISKRPSRDQWETPKALSYFREKFKGESARYGLPLLRTDGKSPEQVIQELREIPKYYSEVRAMALNGLTRGKIQEMDISARVPVDQVSMDNIRGWSNEFKTGDPELAGQEALINKIKARWLINGTVTPAGEGKEDQVIVEREGVRVQIETNALPPLQLIREGESKRVYRIITKNPYLKDLAVIMLKPTIYSHSKQATGEIAGLAEVRAKGTQVFLEMMWRNGLRHTYRQINKEGIILSEFLPEVPVTEVVVKKYCLGTDKHSFYGMVSTQDVVLPEGEYKCGPYVRMDWRNPNHLHMDTGRNPTENPYYYLIEEHYGKEAFFQRFLKPDPQHPCAFKPFGDKTVPDVLVRRLIDLKQTRESVLKMFFTTQHYFQQVGLEIQDVCYMLNREGQVFWSEINPDCMRIVASSTEEHYDKDLWRTGGSGAKKSIVQKWTQCTKILMEYFDTRPFHSTEMLQHGAYAYDSPIRETLKRTDLDVPPEYRKMYQDLLQRSGGSRKRVIVTMDLHDQKPALVKSGRVDTYHSNGDPTQAFNTISLFPDVLCVDLNGAFGDKVGQQANRREIKDLAKKHYVHVGGGLRTLEDVQEILASSARRIVVSSNTDPEFLRAIPPARLIVELSVNSQDEVLIHGRETNTRVSVFDKLCEMGKLGVEVVSVTCHSTEGHLEGLDREQILRIHRGLPTAIQKLIIAGGITNLDDLAFLWSLDRVIPQLGSAIWKGTILPGDLYVAMTNFDSQGLVPAVIQDTNGICKGLVYLDDQALRQTCHSRKLHRYSRQHGRLMLKGESSGDVQQVLQISHDCNNNSLLITVDSERPLCHTGNHSCYSIQTSIKGNLGGLQEFIDSRKGGQSYSAQMQRHPGLALCKVMEEFWEVVTANRQHQVAEMSDLLIHLMMYMRGVGVRLDEIMNELNARRWDPKMLTRGEQNVGLSTENRFVLAITGSKHTPMTDKFMLEHLGMEVRRPEGRNMRISFRLVDKEKYQRWFGEKEVTLVPCRPKDMARLIAFGRVDGVVASNSTMDNFPPVSQLKHAVSVPELRLCLIKRKGETVKFEQGALKTLIAAEHINHVFRHLEKEGYPPESYSVDLVVGSSEGFLVNTPRHEYKLCDAIVETGQTLLENDLEVHADILPPGQITIGLYQGYISDARHQQ